MESLISNVHTISMNSFYELVRRAYPSEQDYSQLHQKLDQYPLCDAFVHALEDNPHDNHFFEQSDWPYLALNAVRLNKLSKATFATLMGWWVLFQDFVPQKRVWMPLFNEKGIETETFQVLYRALKTNENNTRFFSAKQLRRAIYSVRGAVNKAILIYPDRLAEWRRQSLRPHLMDGITKGPHLALLDRFLYKGLPYRMWVPFELIEAIFKQKFKDQVMEPNYVIAFSSENDIAIGNLQRKRDVVLPFMGCPLPQELDNALSPELDATRHDMPYHVLLCSSIPQNHIDASYFLSELAKSLIRGEDRIKDQAINKFIQRLNDLEFTVYRYDVRFIFKPFDEDELVPALFWVNLSMVLALSFKKDAAKFEVEFAKELMLALLPLRNKFEQNFFIQLSLMKTALILGLKLWGNHQNNHMRPLYEPIAFQL